MSFATQAFPAACGEPSSATNIRPVNGSVGGTSAGDDSDRKLRTLSRILDKRRGGRKRLAARGAKLANLIVNRLLVSEGAAAMGVALVSEDLRGEIHIPLDYCWLPLPGVLLSGLFTKVPYHTICEDIGIPNLAPLQFTPFLSTGFVAVGFEMSEIRKAWDVSVSKHLELQAIRGRYNFGDGAAAGFSGRQGNPHSQTFFCKACTVRPASGRGHSGRHVGGNVTAMVIDLDDTVESGTKYP
ncbi:hypothetical protein J7T55_004206 [Diaporthe amygdali]|uniref:uncharacterized protein n=1 Tax=Phomopsis amygdali TaxID=1214568 RepID=UPI0022FDD962|nr:uncharacterized protein J7T55_004206 [Diaporthe amygdali]KAJ0103803.1 hypothetical protein J7T55_004206 [Diaporthe amygdali]